MKIDCISDLHGNYPELEGGDLLIIAGDLTAMDTIDEFIQFRTWVSTQQYRKIVIIGGNHDNCLQDKSFEWPRDPAWKKDHSYLEDSGTEFEGLKIWGSPWTARFPNQNPECMAFALDADELKSKWDLIPEDTDILITHSPPYGILDHTWKLRTGCSDLLERVKHINPKLHVFGHIHENGGKSEQLDIYKTIFVNASVVNENYKHINKPVPIVL